MGVKVAATCFQWSQPMVPRSPSSSQILASAMSSPSSKRRCRADGAGVFLCRYVRRLERSALLGTKLQRARSFDYPKSTAGNIKRACSASLDDAFSEEEFAEEIQEMALRFQPSDEDDGGSYAVDSEPVIVSEDSTDRLGFNEAESFRSINDGAFSKQFSMESLEPPWSELRRVPPDWSIGDDNILASIERKANSVDIPLSLRIIKRKMQWQEGLREAGESACCSVKKAFSSMVFIIREIHSFTLQMREFLFTEDLQGILHRVQREMHASFVWLFQQVFSHTPTLMVYVMILLANFTVCSMGSNAAALAASPPPGSYESVSVVEVQDQKFDSSMGKTSSISSSSGKFTFIGGSHGGGGKTRPVASGTDGDGSLNRSEQFTTIVPDAALHLTSSGTAGEADHQSMPRGMTEEEELNLWNLFVKEASKMQASLRGVLLDHETIQRLVAPITAKIEPDDYADYFRTELLYQMGLSQEPNNSLLLSNYAQFLYLVAHDFDRAEEYFKRAIGVQPPDAEAYSKYANFLWRVKKDLWAAEETFLEAISAEPTNSLYAANYANFLWNTGGEDTCFPLSSPDNNNPQEV